jgi:death on curing protein
MRYLTLDEVLDLHRLSLEQSGGAEGLCDLGLLQSAMAQPEMTFGGQDLYPGVADKAVALGYSLIMNHPFVDGNKRVGHAAMETFLVLNGYEIVAGVDEQEQLILGVAAGAVSREVFLEWVRTHIVERGPTQALPLNGPGS